MIAMLGLTAICYILVKILIVGFVLWFINYLISRSPMPADMKQVVMAAIYVIGVIAVIVYFIIPLLSSVG
jgi:hypothetical protein